MELGRESHPAGEDSDGYDPKVIPALILKHNLIGIEMDDRAGALAAFALAMKAAEKLGQRRFLRMDVKPDIVVLREVAYRCLHILLKREGLQANWRKLYRIYREERLDLDSKNKLLTCVL